LSALTDGRVLLRATELRDLDAIDRGMHDPEVVRWIGPPWPIAEVLPRHEALRRSGAPTFAICELDDSCVGLVWLNLRDADPATRSVGYWLLPGARGRGLATSAVRLISRWAFDELDVSSVRLTTAPENDASQRVAERSGFRRLGSGSEVAVERRERGQVVFELTRAA
jgi:RimJ/RimL family protein N-acetyltransferase